MTSLVDLPPEITDHIIDFLYDDRRALGSCCLVSREFVHPTRKYLFKDIMIMGLEMLQRWEKTFPDPANSPVQNYIRSLIFHGVEGITTEGVEGGHWTRRFTNVIRLEVCDPPGGPLIRTSLDPFYILSAVKSLRVHTISIPSLEVFKLICSLRRLEDLDIIHFYKQFIEDINEWENLFQAPTSPPLTGTLQIGKHPLNNTACLLLALPVGLHFKKIVWEMDPLGELGEMEALVEACSDTLEYIYIENPPNEHAIHSINLSKARNLTKVAFQFEYPARSISWITGVLRIVAARDGVLPKILIHTVIRFDEPHSFRLGVQDQIHNEWMVLDDTLACELHPCHVEVVVYGQPEWSSQMQGYGEAAQGYIVGLFPQMTRKGLISVVYSEHKPNKEG